MNYSVLHEQQSQFSAVITLILLNGKMKCSSKEDQIKM